MSKVTKRKHVMKEIQADDFDPPGPNQQIVRILGSRGNNLHEVESADSIAKNDSNENTDDDETKTSNDHQFLVSMPTKFRKNVWVKRGDYVIVEPIDEGDKVKAEIVRILTPQHIKEFTKDGIWPEKFRAKNNNDAKRINDAYESDDSSDNDDELFKNTNRAHQYIESDNESEEEATDDSEDDKSTSKDENT